MRLAAYFVFALGLSLGVLPACRQDAPAPTTSPAGITGQVLAFDQQATAQPLSAADITVTVLDLTPTVTTTTNAAGEFALPQLPAGTYNLRFSRPGLSSFYLRGIRHPDAAQPTPLPERYLLYAEPDVQATALRATTTAGTISLDMTLRSPQPTIVFRYALYLSDSPTVSFATAPLLQQGGAGSLAPGTVQHIDLTFSRSQLVQAGAHFAAGTTVYVVAHGAGLRGLLYTDPANGQRQTWPSLNLLPSPVASFTMP